MVCCCISADVPFDNYGALAQARLETLLVKEAEQRAGDDIHPRLDQQILDGDTPFGPYETFRRILVEFILTVWWLRYPFARLFVHPFSSGSIHRSHPRLLMLTEGAIYATSFRLRPIHGSLQLT